MIETTEIEQLIKKSFPDARVQVSDMTGTGDHFEILVISNVFKGKLLIDQHRLVQKAIESEMHDDRIHAVRIQTETSESFEKRKSKGNDFTVIH